MNSRRIEQVNELIKREISQILLREVDFPENVLITVTRAESAPNLFEAKVWVSVMPEENLEKIVAHLNRQVYEIQQKINKRLKMRPVPRIKFLKEKQTVQAGRIEELLEKLKKEEK